MDALFLKYTRKLNIILKLITSRSKIFARRKCIEWTGNSILRKFLIAVAKKTLKIETVVIEIFCSVCNIIFVEYFVKSVLLFLN